MSDLETRLSSLEAEALSMLSESASVAQLTELKRSLFGSKGSLTGLLRGMGQVPKDDRPRVGALVNQGPPSAWKAPSTIDRTRSKTPNSKRSFRPKPST